MKRVCLLLIVVLVLLGVTATAGGELMVRSCKFKLVEPIKGGGYAWYAVHGILENVSNVNFDKTWVLIGIYDSKNTKIKDMWAYTPTLGGRERWEYQSVQRICAMADRSGRLPYTCRVTKVIATPAQQSP